MVIAIIGLLATLAVVSFGNARTKARDAKRVADINSALKALQTANYDDNDVAITCTANELSTCTGTGMSDYINFSSLSDPDSTLATICNSGSAAACDYGFDGTRPSNFTIWFWLESGSGSLGAGLHSASGSMGIR